MATVSNPNIDTNQDPNSSQNSGQNGQFQPVNLSNSGSGGSSSTPNGVGGSKTAAPTISPNANTSSGRFTNLSNYLQANKGYNNGQGLGGKVNSDLDNQSGQIQNSFNTAQNQFTNDANQNRVQYDSNLVNQATTDPYAFSQDQNNVSNFAKQRDAQYNGPTDLAQGNQLQGQAAGFQSTANLGTTESGRYALLNQLYGTPGYTQGQQTLDNLLLQSNPSQLQNIANQKQKAQALTNNITTGIAGDQALGQQYGAEAQNTQQQTRGALGNTITGFGSAADQQAQQAMADRDTAYQSALGNLSQGKITSNDLNQFGLNANQGLYGIDPSKYLSEGTMTATGQNVINNDQYNKIQALSKLSGGVLTGDPSATLAAFSGPSQAGQFAAAPQYNFDTNGFNTNTTGNQANYTAGYNQQLKDAASWLPGYAQGRNYQGPGQAAFGQNFDTGNINTNLANASNDLARLNTKNAGYVHSFDADQQSHDQAQMTALQNLINTYGINAAGTSNGLQVI